jgi:hypothetical protein
MSSDMSSERQQDQNDMGKPIPVQRIHQLQKKKIKSKI